MRQKCSVSTKCIFMKNLLFIKQIMTVADRPWMKVHSTECELQRTFTGSASNETALAHWVCEAIRQAHHMSQRGNTPSRYWCPPELCHPPQFFSEEWQWQIYVQWYHGLHHVLLFSVLSVRRLSFLWLIQCWMCLATTLSFGQVTHTVIWAKSRYVRYKLSYTKTLLYPICLSLWDCQCV